MNIEDMDGMPSQTFRKPETVHEFGNDQACRNCGDEWDDLTDGYCQECAEIANR